MNCGCGGKKVTTCSCQRLTTCDSCQRLTCYEHLYDEKTCVDCSLQYGHLELCFAKQQIEELKK